jgi:microcystin-dependent protein
MAITLNDEKQTGFIISSYSNTTPPGYLICDGSAVSRTTYANLFLRAPSNFGPTNITAGTPTVVNFDFHGLANGYSIQFANILGSTLPTGMIAGTVYYVRVVDSNNLHLYNTQANAINMSSTTGRINTTGSSSGGPLAFSYFWGNGDGSTTFNVPDLRGAVPRGAGTSSGYIQNITTALGGKDNDAFQDFSGTIGEQILNGGAAGPRFTIVAGAAIPFGSPVGFTYGYIPFSASSFGPRTGNETKMKNVGVNFFIKY